MCVLKVSLHLMHSMDVLDQREASDSSHKTLISSVLPCNSTFYSSSRILSSTQTALYKLKAAENNALYHGGEMQSLLSGVPQNV